jgi:hypothetical protein
MRVIHAPQPTWRDTDEEDRIQASDVVGMDHVVYSAETRLAGVSVSALRAVWEDTTGKVYPLDAQDTDHISLYVGVTRTAAVAGGSVDVQREGAFDTAAVAGLGFSPGPVWLGASGRLTQTSPVSGIAFRLGASLADERLMLSPAEPLFLQE